MASRGQTRHSVAQRFLAELTSAVPVVPLAVSTALRAGQIDGESRSNGVSIPLSDLLIGVTALELDYAVATHNVRHFRLIPDLPVRSL